MHLNSSLPPPVKEGIGGRDFWERGGGQTINEWAAPLSYGRGAGRIKGKEPIDIYLQIENILNNARIDPYFPNTMFFKIYISFLQSKYEGRETNQLWGTTILLPRNMVPGNRELELLELRVLQISSVWFTVLGYKIFITHQKKKLIDLL